MSPPTINRKVFAELQDAAGADFVSELVDSFLEDAPQMLDELRQALLGGNAVGFRRAAHSLKSNALTFGAMDLSVLARELELIGLAELADAAGPAVEALANSYALAAAELSDLRHA